MGTLKQFIKQQQTLERRLFWSILVVVTLVATSSAVFTIFEGLNMTASLCSIGCAAVCLVVALVAVRTSLYDQCYLVLCCVLTCFMLPLLFLFCGGITSGMPLYCITATALLAYAKRGYPKLIAFLVSVAVQVTTLVVTWRQPELVFMELNRDDSYLDILATVILTSITLFAVGAVAMRSYAVERESKEELLSKLDYLSMRDPLTEVYNRRYLMTFLENEVWRRRDSYFLFMLDLDGLEHLNYGYGHAFGDRALCAVAQLLMQKKSSSGKECVARCGSGSFVFVMEDSSEGEALARGEQIRRDVENMRFEENSMVHLTISAGFVTCGNRSLLNAKLALDKVMELLQVAKSLGKNQIRSMMDG